MHGANPISALSSTPFTPRRFPPSPSQFRLIFLIKHRSPAGKDESGEYAHSSHYVLALCSSCWVVRIDSRARHIFLLISKIHSDAFVAGSVACLGMIILAMWCTSLPAMTRLNNDYIKITEVLHSGPGCRCVITIARSKDLMCALKVANRQLALPSLFWKSGVGRFLCHLSRVFRQL